MLRRLATSTLFPYSTLFRSRSDLENVRIADSLAGERVPFGAIDARSEEHTSELQSRFDVVCRLLRDNKNTQVDGDHVKCHAVKHVPRGVSGYETVPLRF